MMSTALAHHRRGGRITGRRRCKGGHPEGRRPAPSPSASSGPARSSKFLGETEVEALSLELAKAQKIPTEVCRDVITEAVESVLAEDYLAEGGVDFARSASCARWARIAPDGDHRPPRGDDRAPPVRVPAPHAGRADRGLPAQRVAADHRAGRLQPAHDAGRPGAVGHRPGDPGRRGPADRAWWPRPGPEVVAHGRERSCARACPPVGSQEYAAAGGVKSLADILNSSDRTTERNVLDELAKADGELAEEIRLLLFTFEDVVKLDDRSIQMVLKEVDQKDLAIALRGVNEDVRGRRSSRTCPSVAPSCCTEEIEFQPPQRKRVVEEAQGRIVGVVRRLEEAGAIVISRGAGPERTRWSRWASSPNSTSRRSSRWRPRCTPADQAAGRHGRARRGARRRRADPPPGRANEGYAAGFAEALEALAPRAHRAGRGGHRVRADAQADDRVRARAPRGRAGAWRWRRRSLGAARCPSSPSEVLDWVQGALRGIVERERGHRHGQPGAISRSSQGVAEELGRLARRHRPLVDRGRAARRPGRLHRAHARG